MLSRRFSRTVLGKILLPTTQSRLPVITQSLEHNARSTLLPVRKSMPELKCPISIERRILILGRLDAFRRINGDTIGLQYTRYLPAVVPKPDEIGQTEETARNGITKAMIVQSSPALVFESLLATPIFDGLVCVIARAAKIWWYRLTPEAKRRYKARTAGWRKTLCAAATFLCGLFAVFLWSKTELDPATGRRRLFLYNDLMLEHRMSRDVHVVIKVYEMFGLLLNTSHPLYKRVAAVVTRLVDANVDVAAVRDRRWHVVVVNARMIGAFATMNGCIFVTTGLADDANDDQLAIVIGHEMSHYTQRHMNQKMSAQLVFDVARLVFIAVVWAALPFFWALFVQILAVAFEHVFLELPLSRAMETEADRDGLMMAAKACVDVAEGGRYWRQLDERMDGKSDRMWWKSTHPSHSTRARRLSALEPEARELQKSVGCGATPANSTANR